MHLAPQFLSSSQWHYNGRDSVSNHQPNDCLLNRYSGTDQRKHQSSASLAFVQGIRRRPVNSPHNWPVTRKMFPFDDIIMILVRFLWIVKMVWIWVIIWRLPIYENMTYAYTNWSAKVLKNVPLKHRALLFLWLPPNSCGCIQNVWFDGVFRSMAAKKIYPGFI